MIVVRIQGGLGNQLFCYAFAKAFAMNNKTKVCLDFFSGFRNDKYKRINELYKLQIRESQASRLRSYQYPLGSIVQKVSRLVNSWLPLYLRWFINEKQFEESSFYAISKRKYMYFEGYWQNPKYHQSIKAVLKDEFKPIASIQQKTASRYAEILNNRNSVGIHVRQLRNYAADYTEVEKFDVSKILPIDYYIKCINFCLDTLSSPIFYVFGDSPEWIIDILPPNTNFIIINNTPDEDAAVMDWWLLSACNHFVLSNSTFAWWASWLQNYKNKIVFAPPVQYWDSSELLDYDAMKVIE